MSKIKAIIAASLCTIGVIASPSMVMANDNMITKSIEVSYSDLDLTSMEGQKSLQRRVNAAARKTCGPASHPTDLATKSCYQKALNSAHTQFATAIQDANTPRLGG